MDLFDRCKVASRYICCCSILLVFPLVQFIYRLSATVARTTTLFETTGVICDILLITTYFFISGGIFAVFWNSHGESNSVRKSFIGDNTPLQENKGHHETIPGPITSPNNSGCNKQLSMRHKYLHVSHDHPIIPKVLLFILGCGDALFNVTRFGDQLLIIISNDCTSDKCRNKIIMSIAENFFKSVSQLFILFFMLNHEKIKPSSPFLCSFIRVLPGSLACQWFIIIMQEVDSEIRHKDDCIKYDRTKPYSFNNTEEYLYPLGTEFRSFAFMELLIIMITICPWRKNQAASNNRRPVSEEFEQQNQEATSREFKKNHSKWHLPCSKVVLWTIGVLLVIFSLAFILFQERYYEEEKSNIILISEICEVMLVCILSIMPIITFFTQSKTQYVGYDSTKKIELVALVIAWMAFQTYCILTLVGSIQYQPTTSIEYVTRGWTITASLISVFQSSLQLILIIAASGRLRFLSEKTLKLWIILSFAMWLFDSFSAKKYSTNRIQLEFYGETVWIILGAIFIPPTIFFRFHSCIMFANIKEN